MKRSLGVYLLNLSLAFGTLVGAIFGRGLDSYFINIAVSLDYLLNAFLAGDPDETLTRRAARAGREGKRWGCIFCRLIDIVDTGHCRRFG